MSEQDFFRPLEEGSIVNMPRGLSYIDPQGNKINVVFGTEYGFPATRFSVTDQSGRLLREGGSFAVNYEQALSGGLGTETGLRAGRILKEARQPVSQLGPLASAIGQGDGFGGRV